MERGEISIEINIKKLFTRKEINLAVIILIFVLFYMLKFSNIPILTRFINGIFIIGAIYIILGMMTYIRNVGLFKTYRYFAYKLKAGAYSRKKMGQVNTLSLAEFTAEITNEKNKRSGKVYYLYGITLVSISYALALIKW